MNSSQVNSLPPTTTRWEKESMEEMAYAHDISYEVYICLLVIYSSIFVAKGFFRCFLQKYIVWVRKLFLELLRQNIHMIVNSLPPIQKYIVWVRKLFLEHLRQKNFRPDRVEIFLFGKNVVSLSKKFLSPKKCLQI